MARIKLYTVRELLDAFPHTLIEHVSKALFRLITKKVRATQRAYKDEITRKESKRLSASGLLIDQKA